MKKKKFAGAAAFTILGMAAWRYQNHHIDIEHMEIQDERLPLPFDGFRIAHISDLHNTCFGIAQKKLLMPLRMGACDAICITGDLIDRRKTNAQNWQPALHFIEGAVKLCEVYYVPGNHEATSPLYPSLKQKLLEAGVHVLENSQLQLCRQQECISILGVKDPKFYPYDKTHYATCLHHLLCTVDSPYTILLAHRPEYFSLYHAEGCCLSLCGHAHGGQIILPNGQGIYAPDQGLFPSYQDGLYQQGNSYMVVSRGMGNSRAPLRIHNHPQLRFITLRKAKQQEKSELA